MVHMALQNATQIYLWLWAYIVVLMFDCIDHFFYFLCKCNWQQLFPLSIIMIYMRFLKCVFKIHIKLGKVFMLSILKERNGWVLLDWIFYLSLEELTPLTGLYFNLKNLILILLQHLKLMNALPIHVECKHQSLSVNYGSSKFSGTFCVVGLAGTAEQVV